MSATPCQFSIHAKAYDIKQSFNNSTIQDIQSLDVLENGLNSISSQQTKPKLPILNRNQKILLPYMENSR